MPRTTVYIVGDDFDTVEKAKSFFGPQGVTVQSYNPSQWRDGLESSFFRNQLVSGMPALASGLNPVDGKANVLPFPGGSSTPHTEGGRVATMNELESKAIETAIQQFRGNLTEAAKALGIGRATLYRKVKQYQIDPTAARKKRAA